MELPFLKSKQKYAGGGSTGDTPPNSDPASSLLGIITEEFMSALERKDRAELIHALRAFISNMNTEDSDATHEG